MTITNTGTDHLLAALDGGVLTLTMNRPEARNAINGALRQDLNAAWERFRDDEDAWVAILTAAGDNTVRLWDVAAGTQSILIDDDKIWVF